eukprot:TRINITY_DN1522_c0_g2_i1.p1 TRINITY_DN1522_c0_g2~~TRINITY_DN1522_c0_g2_i1.p1  ORF type:complete len:633 (-),score=168.83 TRINITY_DN1522_c0_g2_i1:31-1929(-)
MKRKATEGKKKPTEKKKKGESSASDDIAQEICKALKSKKDWSKKIFDDKIAANWRREARDQGVTDEVADRAIALLKFEAITVDSQSKLKSLEKLKSEEYPNVEEDDELSGSDDEEEEFQKDIREPQEGDLSKKPRSDIIFKDDIIPEDLRKRLEKELDEMAESEPKDYHPGSEQKVLNLFHPSNYPYVKGLSINRSSTTRQKFTPIFIPQQFREEGVTDPLEEGDNGFSEGNGNYVCDKCSVNITGNAYLCHVCRDFSLCEGCKEKVFSAHTADHVLSKIFTTYNHDLSGSEDENGNKKKKTPSPADKAGYTKEQLEDVGYSEDAEAEDKESAERQNYMQIFDSVYQWLPAEYKITNFGTKVEIDSYINGLDQNKYGHIYKTLAEVFQYFLPLIKSVVEKTRPIKFDEQEVNLQVITKAANYILKPGEKYKGSWHVEGVPQEHIIASGIYYYSIDKSLKPDATLLFRARRQNETDYAARGEAAQDEPFSINLGYVPTTQGRGVAFENLYLQHKVRGMKNNGDETGTRKILCFFVVDPKNRIVSTRDVPEQRWDKVKKETGYALCMVNKRLGEGVREGGYLPVEILERIMRWAKWGFTKEEAEEHRRKLMHERKYFVGLNNEVWERRFSFCEH